MYICVMSQGFQLSDFTIVHHYAQNRIIDNSWKGSQYIDAVARIYYVAWGDAWVRHHGRVFKLLPDHLYYIPAYTPMDYWKTGDFHLHWVHFSCRLFGTIPVEHAVPMRHVINLDDAENTLFPLLTILEERPNQTTPPSSDIRYTGLLASLLSLFMTESGEGSVDRIHGGLALLSRIKPAVEYCDRNLAGPLDVALLANLANLERSYFSKSFKKLLGVSPRRYIMRKRVEAAKTLLLASGDTLDVISRRTGFSDAFHLSRVFKQITGRSPDCFRREGGDALP